MNEYSQEAGLLLRRLRRQRNFTLKQVAPQFNRSIAALSRTERGEEQIARSDIQRAIEVFQLTAWEAFQLWLAAGYIPEVQPRKTDLHTLATTVLAALSFPALVLDTIGYVQAWNRGIETIWAPSQSSPCPHMIGDLFAERVRLNMGEQWTPYVRQALAVFYHKTLRLANDPAFRRLLAHLTKTHGDEFIDLWNGAQLNWRGNGALRVTAAATTNALGQASATLTAPKALGQATVTISAGALRTTLMVDFVAGAATRLTVTATPATIRADGVSVSTIQVLLQDGSNHPVANQTVNFVTDRGAISSVATTNAAGIATATLTAGRQAGVATVRATAGGLEGIATVTLTNQATVVHLPLIRR